MNDGALADQLREWAHIALRDNDGTAMADVMLEAASRLRALHAHTLAGFTTDANAMLGDTYCSYCDRYCTDDGVEHCSDCPWVERARAAGFKLPVSHVVVDETKADMRAREAAEPRGEPVDIEDMFPDVSAPRGRVTYTHTNP